MDAPTERKRRERDINKYKQADARTESAKAKKHTALHSFWENDKQTDRERKDMQKSTDSERHAQETRRKTHRDRQTERDVLGGLYER
jgi:hypothetical protein